MPLSTNPNATARFWLDSDRDVPLSRRPVFLIRFLTGDEIEKHADLIRQAYDTADDQACYQLLEQAVSIGVVGWQNFKGEFSVREAMRILTDRERWELARFYPSAVRLTDLDKLFSASPPGGAGAASAEVAAPVA